LPYLAAGKFRFMKKLSCYLALLLGVAAVPLAAQGPDTLRNKPGSAYLFSRVKDNAATQVRNQCQTSTCWSFSTLSFLESELLRKGKGVYNLSEMYVVRHAYYEKAVMYLRMDGDHRFDEGGEGHDIPLIIRKYGIVPEEFYRGLAYKSNPGDTIHNHGELVAALKALVNAYKPFSQAGKLSPAWQRAVNGVLDAYFGPLPASFQYAGKSFTPQTFAQSLDLNMDDYVVLTSYTHQPYYRPFVLELPDNWSLQQAFNIPLEDFEAAAFSCLNKGYTFAWAADVSEKGFSFKDGLAVLPVHDSLVKAKGEPARFSNGRSLSAFDQPYPQLQVDAALRQQMYDYKTTTDDHGMQMTGWYRLADGSPWFRMRNSWGTGNALQGYQMVSLPYFRAKTISIMLPIEALDKDLRKELNLD
jgi:bleomycin hydrolase